MATRVFLKGTFAETGLWAYTGIEASQAALGKSRLELTGAGFQVQLFEADILAHLREPTGPAAKAFDVILASYAVHHLPAREKQDFFRLVHATLGPRGSPPQLLECGQPSTSPQPCERRPGGRVFLEEPGQLRRRHAQGFGRLGHLQAMGLQLVQGFGDEGRMADALR